MNNSCRSTGRERKGTRAAAAILPVRMDGTDSFDYLEECIELDTCGSGKDVLVVRSGQLIRPRCYV